MERNGYINFQHLALVASHRKTAAVTFFQPLLLQFYFFFLYLSDVRTLDKLFVIRL